MLHIGQETVAVYYHCAADRGFFTVLHDFGDEQEIAFINLHPGLDTPQKCAAAAKAMSCSFGRQRAMDSFMSVIGFIRNMIPNPEYVFECIREDGEPFESFVIRLSQCKFMTITPTLPTEHAPPNFDASLN